ncbi:MAG: hypothetical protein N2482_01575 [Patescibacteria group bacterium]|nr:hypothetical protein [Patescibacteria group bacterium]
MKIAQEMSEIFGTVAPPISSIPTNPIQAFGTLVSAGIKIFIFVASLTLLVYMMWGAYDWIVSGGEKEKIAKAQQKITNAVIGIFVLIAVLSVFCIITVDVLHLTDQCLNFKIPTLSP